MILKILKHTETIPGGYEGMLSMTIERAVT